MLLPVAGVGNGLSFRSHPIQTIPWFCVSISLRRNDIPSKPFNPIQTIQWLCASISLCRTVIPSKPCNPIQSKPFHDFVFLSFYAGMKEGNTGRRILQPRSWAVVQCLVPFLSLQGQESFVTSGVILPQPPEQNSLLEFWIPPSSTRPQEANGEHCFFTLDNTAFFRWKTLLFSNGEHFFFEWRTLLFSRGPVDQCRDFYCHLTLNSKHSFLTQGPHWNKQHFWLS